MKVRPLSPCPRVAFVGPSKFAIHTPSRSDWCVPRFFPVDDGWDAAIAAFQPDVTVVFEPDRVTPEVGWDGLVLGAFLPSATSSRARRSLSQTAITWLLCDPELVPQHLAFRKCLGMFVPPLDVSRLAMRPALDGQAVLCSERAPPPGRILEELRMTTGLRMIQAASAPEELIEATAGGGILVCDPQEAIRTDDPLPLLGLGQGMLLIAAREFPTHWNIEQEDEYLVRPGTALLSTVAEARRRPALTRAIRARGWQKIRESYAADAAFHRLVHDAQVLSRIGP